MSTQHLSTFRSSGVIANFPIFVHYKINLKLTISVVVIIAWPPCIPPIYMVILRRRSLTHIWTVCRANQTCSGVQKWTVGWAKRLRCHCNLRRLVRRCWGVVRTIMINMFKITRTGYKTSFSIRVAHLRVTRFGRHHLNSRFRAHVGHVAEILGPRN